MHHIQYFFSVWSCLVFPLTINPTGLLCYITISILFSICLWQLIFWGIWSWIWTLWIKATFYYCIGIRHCHLFERKLSWPKQILFLKCANRQKKVQVNVWNIICSQLTYIEVNQSRKKKILKFYLRQTSKLPFNLPYTTKCLRACINKTFVTSQMNHHMVSIGQQQGYFKHVSQIHK